jgi:hypothetical protein
MSIFIGIMVFGIEVYSRLNIFGLLLVNILNWLGLHVITRFLCIVYTRIVSRILGMLWCNW